MNLEQAEIHNILNYATSIIISTVPTNTSYNGYMWLAKTILSIRSFIIQMFRNSNYLAVLQAMQTCSHRSIDTCCSWSFRLWTKWAKSSLTKKSKSMNRREERSVCLCSAKNYRLTCSKLVIHNYLVFVLQFSRRDCMLGAGRYHCYQTLSECRVAVCTLVLEQIALSERKRERPAPQPAPPTLSEAAVVVVVVRGNTCRLPQHGQSTVWGLLRPDICVSEQGSGLIWYSDSVGDLSTSNDCQY